MPVFLPEGRNFRGEQLGDAPVLLSFFPVARRRGQLRIGGDAHRRLNREIHVVFEMPGEIVRAQLIFRFQAVFGEILRPFLRKGRAPT